MPGEGGDTLLLDPNYGLTTLTVTGGTGNDVLRIAAFDSTADIARAFLDTEPTMGQRLSRAKAKKLYLNGEIAPYPLAA